MSTPKHLRWVLISAFLLVAACAPPPSDGGGTTTTTLPPQDHALQVDPEVEVENIYIFDLWVGQHIAQGVVLYDGESCAPFTTDPGSGELVENEPCEYQVTGGSEVELVAVPYESAVCDTSCEIDEMSLVGTWTGCDDVPAPDRCLVTMDGPRAVTHTFELP